MKKSLFFALPLLIVLVARGQSLVNFNNRVTGVVVAPIYGVDPLFPYTQVRGDSSLFSGPLLAGSGYTAELWGGPLGSTEESLVPVAATTFRSGVSAGYVVPVQVPFAVVASGERATFQVRAWDNLDGVVTSWSQAQSGSFGPFGSSALFSPPDGLGANPLNLVGLTSFNLVVPEPSVIALAVLGGGLVLLRCLSLRSWPDWTPTPGAPRRSGWGGTGAETLQRNRSRRGNPRGCPCRFSPAGRRPPC